MKKNRNIYILKIDQFRATCNRLIQMYKMVCVPSNLTYETLLEYGIVRVDPNSFVYDLRSLLNTHNKIARFKIQNDRDTICVYSWKWGL